MARLQRAGKRILPRVIEQKQAHPAREAQTAGRTHVRALAEQSSHPHPGRFHGDDPGNLEQAAGVGLQREALDLLREQQDGKRVLRRQ